MRTLEVVIKQAYESKNGMPASIFAKPVDIDDTRELVLDSKYKTIKVSGTFSNVELRSERLILNLGDTPTKDGYYTLLFTGSIPKKEDFKDLIAFIAAYNFTEKASSILKKDKPIIDTVWDVIKSEDDIKDVLLQAKPRLSKIVITKRLRPSSIATIY